MKTKIFILITLLAGFTLKAEAFPPYTKLQCNGYEGGSFVYTNHTRTQAQAKIVSTTEPYYLAGDLLWLVDSSEGGLSSQVTYTDNSRGSLIISERVFVGRGGCGRGSCEENGQKIITAKVMSADGQEYYYSCEKI